MEIDFLITCGYDDAAGRMRVSPIEVKSTKRYGIRSLDKFKDKFTSRVGTRYVLHPKPLSAEGEYREASVVYVDGSLRNSVRFGA